MESVLWTHFARHEAQVYQLTVTTDAACLHSTQECQWGLDAEAQTTAMWSVSTSSAAEFGA